MRTRGMTVKQMIKMGKVIEKIWKEDRVLDLHLESIERINDLILAYLETVGVES